MYFNNTTLESEKEQKKSMTKNFLNMVKDICLQIQEAQQIPKFDLRS